MVSMESGGTETGSRDSKIVVFLQLLLPLSFTCAMLGLIAWIISLIILSRKLDDVPSASMGISIVAIPVFLVLLSIFWYVFLGIIRNQEPDEEEDEMGEAAGNAGVNE